MGRTAAVVVAALLATSAWAQSASIDATTASGEKVKLYADGRWEFADPIKAEPQKKAREAELERERSSQGGWFGIGRRVQEGDKDYNRGTLNPARR